MKITPLDIDGQTFRKRMRGYDREEVDSFLRALSEEYEKLFSENLKLHEDLTRMESLLAEHRQREKTLQETLVTAQRMSDEIREQAQREASVVQREAEIRAHQLVESAQRRAAKLEGSLGELRLERVAYLQKARVVLEQHLQILDMHEQEAREEEKVQVLRRREAGGAS